MFWPCSIGYSNFRSFTEGIFTLWNHFRDGHGHHGVTSVLKYLAFLGITEGPLAMNSVTGLLPRYLSVHFILCFQMHLFFPQLSW